MNSESKIEAILFYKAEPVRIRDLSKIIGEDEASVKESLAGLEKSLTGRGLGLVWKDDAVALATSPLAKNLVEKLLKEDLEKDLGKAGLETLSIVLYMGPVKRSDIDYVRGVNSTFILRNLLVRDLVEKIENPRDQRSFLYRPTFKLLSYLGIPRVEELPEYEKTKLEIESFKKEPAETPDSPDSSPEDELAGENLEKPAK